MNTITPNETYKRDWHAIADWIEKDKAQHLRCLGALFGDDLGSLLDYIIDSSAHQTPNETTLQTIQDILLFIDGVETGGIEIVKQGKRPCLSFKSKPGTSLKLPRRMPFLLLESFAS